MINIKHLFVLLLAVSVRLDAQEAKDNRQINFPKVEEHVKKMPPKDKVWVFMMAGQSNMAGRGIVEAEDTLSNSRIITLNKNKEWIYAKEPLHFYQPALTGLDCGMSFANELLKGVPEDVTIAIVPCAVGGSSIDKWLLDVPFKNMQLRSNLEERIAYAKQFGEIKAILWHQGESDAMDDKIPVYADKLKRMFRLMRSYSGNEQLPILTGKLGTYSDPKKYASKWERISAIIEEVAGADPYTYLVKTKDLTSNPDKIHFDARSQRKLGKRFAKQYKKLIK